MYNAALIMLSLIVTDLLWMIHEMMIWKLRKQNKALMMLLLQVMHIHWIIYTCGAFKTIVLYVGGANGTENQVPKLNWFWGKT